MNVKQIWPILKATTNEFLQDKVLRLSAALAYYAIFSIGPLLAIAVGIAGLAFSHDQVQHQIQHELKGMVGESSAKMISSMMATTTQHQSRSLITTIVGIVALLVGAGGVFGQLQDSLNTVWEVQAEPGKGFWSFLRSRFLSFAMVLVICFLLLVSLALTTVLNAVIDSFAGRLPISGALANALNFIISFGVISLLFAMIFKVLPDIKVPYSKVWVGAIGTALLFTVGKYLLALYLSHVSRSSAYGAAGSVIIVLMWVYYASVILFFGAEFTQVYARRTGTVLVPKKHAVRLTPSDRVHQGLEGSGGKP
jgi:membrane protein